MSKVLQLRGGTSAEHSNFVGADREVTIDVNKKTLIVHDGVTQGGHALAKKSDVDKKLDINGGTLNGPIIGIKEKAVIMAATNNIDLSLGNLFIKTISEATTFTISNTVAVNTVSSFILELTNGGSSVISWFAGVKWSNGTIPTLTAAGIDILGFYTYDGGVTWRGIVLSKNSK